MSVVSMIGDATVPPSRPAARLMQCGTTQSPVTPPMKKHTVLSIIGPWFATALALDAQTTPSVATPSMKPDDETVQLSPFSVSETSEKEYGVTSLAGATRLNTPIREIPQSVSVFTREFMNIMGATNISDISIWAPNVAPRQNVYDGNVIRSFIVFNSYNDGVRNFNGAYQSDLANFQRIEIIKGPAAAVTGIGEVGGFVNRVSKAPMEFARYETKFVVGSEQFRRWDFDATGPLTPDKKVLYRTVFAYQNNFTTIPGQSQERTLFAPQVELRPWVGTNVRVQYEYQDVHDPNDFGGVFRPNVANSYGTATAPNEAAFIFPNKIYTGDTFSGNNNIVHNMRATWTQKLTNALQLRVLANGFRGDLQAGRAIIAGFNALPNGQWVFNRGYDNSSQYIKTFNTQADLVAIYKTGPIKHSTLLGYEYIWNYSTGTTLTGTLAPLNLFNPVYGIAPTNLALTANQLAQTIQAGTWLQQQSKMLNDRLVLTAGIRFDKASITTKNRINNTFTRTLPIQEEYVKAPRLGATFALTKELSIYGIYSSGALPPTQRRQFPNSATDQTIITATTEGKLKEAGVKGDIWGGRISVAAAYFQLQQTGFFQNNTRSDGTQENVIIAGNEIKGAEIEVVAAPTSALRILASYTNNFKAVNMFSGVPTQTTPKQKATFFAKYQVTKKIAVFGGGLYLGEMVASGGAPIIYGQYNYSGGAEYKLPKGWVLGLNVQNLTNELFINGLVSYGSNGRAPFRNWKLRIQRNW